MSKLPLALAALTLCAVPMYAGTVDHVERVRWFASAPSADPLDLDHEGPSLAGAALGFGRTEFFQTASHDASTGYFLTPTFFAFAFWGFGFQAFDFGDSGWGWGWGWGYSDFVPQVTCFGGFCLESEPWTPPVTYNSGGSDPGPPALGLSTPPPPAGSLLPGSLPPADEPFGTPEPGTFALLGAGLAMAVLKRRVR